MSKVQKFGTKLYIYIPAWVITREKIVAGNLIEPDWIGCNKNPETILPARSTHWSRLSETKKANADEASHTDTICVNTNEAKIDSKMSGGL